MSVSPHASMWTLDPAVAYLNHGAFGACPVPVLAAQQAWRATLERQPHRFLMDELPVHLLGVRRALGALIGAEPEDLAFVHNATAGVNTVLASYPFERGDAVLVTSHGYRGCTNAARYWTARSGAEVQVAELPFPIESWQTVIDRVLAAITPRTRLAIIDHVTSPTGLVLPVADLAAALAPRGIDTLIDGAHAPGMLPLDVPSLGATYYTGNLHKWCCCPKSAGFLWVRADRQAEVRPLVISHGASLATPSHARFRLEFDWPGSWDPTSVLALPAALTFLSSLYPGGLTELMERNRSLVLHGRKILADALGTELPCPASMIGSLAAVLFPEHAPRAPSPVELYQALVARGFEVPIVPFDGFRSGFVRVSAQAYNDPSQYEGLGRALHEALGL